MKDLREARAWLYGQPGGIGAVAARAEQEGAGKVAGELKGGAPPGAAEGLEDALQDAVRELRAERHRAAAAKDLDSDPGGPGPL